MLRFLLVCAALMPAACAPPSGADAAAERFLARRAALANELTACARDSGTPFAALAAQARCLVFETPEDPARPDGRQVRLRVMRIPSFLAVPASDPLVILVGGPGQAATEAGLAVAALLSEVRQRREILLVDQRGTGALSPFGCTFEEEEERFDSSLPFILERQAELLGACLSSVDAAPAFYTTDLAVRDLELIREHFGYTAFNLWGGSYGTRVALAYLDAYPDTTRSVVLDGVAPPALRLPLNLARDASESFTRVLALCADDPGCAAAFPDLEERFRALLERLREPQAVALRDPRTGEERRIEIGRDLLAPLLRTALYSREYIRLLPLMIEQAWRGDYRALAALSPAEAGIDQGMFLSVICSEDMSRIGEDDVAAALAEDHLLGSELLVRPLVEACRQWPTRALDPGFFEPVSAHAPVLILSGALDPVTPPRWGALVAETLPNARHLVADGVAHIVTPYGCAPELITDFIAAAGADELDAGCLGDLAPRPFFLGLGGSEAIDD